MRYPAFLVCLLVQACTSVAPSEQSSLEEQPDIEMEWEGSEDGGCAASWVLTYALEGTCDVTETPLGMGDDSARVGGYSTDRIVLRFADNNGEPDLGQVLITDYHITQYFTIVMEMLGSLSITTDLTARASDECGLASGMFTGSLIEWEECEATGAQGTTSWTPDQGAFGTGCLSDYHVTGEIVCVDDSLAGGCSDGWLDDGANVQDYIYNQPLLSFQFDSEELETFVMTGPEYGTEIPTYSNNRTWLALEGTLISKSLEETPDCLCQ